MSDEISEREQSLTLLKKPEIKRPKWVASSKMGLACASTARGIKKAKIIDTAKAEIATPNRGRGRPPGSKNKTTLAMREMILESLDRVGGVDYLARLAIENSSAYASLLGKVLPSTLAIDENSPPRRSHA